MRSWKNQSFSWDNCMWDQLIRTYYNNVFYHAFFDWTALCKTLLKIFAFFFLCWIHKQRKSFTKQLNLKSSNQDMLHRREYITYSVWLIYNDRFMWDCFITGICLNRKSLICCVTLQASDQQWLLTNEYIFCPRA